MVFVDHTCGAAACSASHSWMCGGALWGCSLALVPRWLRQHLGIRMLERPGKGHIRIALVCRVHVHIEVGRLVQGGTYNVDDTVGLDMRGGPP